MTPTPEPVRPTEPVRPDAPETAEEWEQLRRSVAMLPPGAWALRREPALRVLGTLLALVRRR